MMTIGYLTSEYPAPSHTFIRREIVALRARGLRVLPYSVRQTAVVHEAGELVPTVLGTGLFRRGLHAGLMALRHPVRAFDTWLLAQRHRPPGIEGWIWSQFHFVEAIILSVMLRNAGIRHLHSHFANSGATVGMLASHFIRIPWSMTLHGISETDYPAGLLLSSKLQRARFVACASWFIRAQALRIAPFKLSSKLHLVRCGIDISALPQPIPVLQTSAVRLICVGRLSPEKGQLGLLEAMSRMIEEGVDVRLTIVGDGPLRASLQSQIARSGLSDRVHLRGALPEWETLEEIARADIFVLPSLMEGLPVVLMEAMALGKPVVAPNVAGIPELVDPGVSGFLYRPGDWNQLAQQILTMTADRSGAIEMANRGKAVVQSEFDINLVIDPLFRLFEGQRSEDSSVAEI